MRKILLFVLLFLIAPSLVSSQTLWERKRNATVWELPDGKLQAKITTYPQNYQDKQGKWQSVDTNIESDVVNEYTHTVYKADYRWRFSDTGSVSKIDYAGKYVIFRPQKTLPLLTSISAPSKEAKFHSIWNSVEVIQTPIPEGVKEQIVLKNGNAQNIFRFRVESNADYEFKNDVLSFDNGNIVVNKPYCIDSGGLLYPVVTEFNGTYYTITIDTTEAQYPLYLDPTITIKPAAAAGKDAPIDSYATYQDNNYGAYAFLGIGEWNSDVRTLRTLIQFDLSGIDPTATVSATACSLIMAADNDRANNTSVVHAHRMATYWAEGTGVGTETNDGATWNEKEGEKAWTTAGAWGTHAQVDTVSRGTYSCTASEAVGTAKVLNDANFVALVQGWIDGTYTNYGMLLKSDGESDDGYYYYSSDEAVETLKRPSLTVTYSVAAASSSVSSSNGTPQANVKYRDGTPTANTKTIDGTPW